MWLWRSWSLAAGAGASITGALIVDRAVGNVVLSRAAAVAAAAAAAALR